MLADFKYWTVIIRILITIANQGIAGAPGDSRHPNG